MGGPRNALRSYPALAALIVAAALLLRVIVPAGYMPSVDHGRMTLTLCSGYGPMKMGAMTMPGMAHHDDQAPAAKSPCAFADLALPLLPAVDAILLAAALLFAFAAALRPACAAPRARQAYLRPPLRGPPLPI